MAITKEAFASTLLASIATSQRSETPYRHWFLRHCLPDDAVDQILALPFAPPSLDGASGKRVLHNATHKYFDVENRGRFPVCEGFCQAFQDKVVTDGIADHFGATLVGTFLRVEAAQDADGSWLEPHSDLGVKAFTMLLYISREPQHAALGTTSTTRTRRTSAARRSSPEWRWRSCPPTSPSTASSRAGSRACANR